MCGIAGVIGENIQKDLIKSMLHIIKHRGPDYQGFFISDNVQIGHARLAIIDLSKSANQPFISKEHNIVVAVNGEIYNFQDIKKPLLRKGYKFYSKSDSEVILHAYNEYGLSFIPELNGMFAISIWDGRKKELILIRDRLGIKPLYYAKAGTTFLFASEIKALAQYRELNLSLDMQSFGEYLAFENYFSNRTLYENIKIVEPGEIVKFKLQNKRITRSSFWDPEFAVLNTKGKLNNNENIYNEYINRVQSSVNRHLISDVPLGSYLSAGMDSSSVVYWTIKELGKNIKTFTGDFGINGFYDEAKDVEKLADFFGCSNKRVKITPEDFKNNFEKIFWHLDEPRVGMGSFSQYMVAKEASDTLKVILTGHGGDEFFAGYPVFKAIYGKQHSLKLLFNSSIRELLYITYFNFYSLIRKEIKYFLPNIFSLASIGDLLNKDFYDDFKKQVNIFKEPEKLKAKYNDNYTRLTMTYLKYYLPALFIVEDKISMAFSLESRTPLCDNQMLDFALSIPLSNKLKNFELKHISRTAMKGRLPGFLYNLPKRGFPTPLKLWFRKELKNFIREYINDNFEYLDNIFNKNQVLKIVNKHQNSVFMTPFSEINAHKIWIILNLIIFFKNKKHRYSYN